MEKISIILVDDHKLFREGLHLLLDCLDYVGTIYEAADASELYKILEIESPNVIFMDIDLPGTDGIDATRYVSEKYPQVNIIALSMYCDDEYYSRMIDAGAKGFILKNSGMSDVEAAIQHVMVGRSYFSQEILATILNSINRKKQTVKNTVLSEREIEVLYQICKGLSNQEIADVLGIGKRTVDKHRENLLSKTYSKNTAGLVMYAIKNELIEV